MSGVDAQKSLVLGGVGLLAVSAVLNLGGEWLASSPKLTILGGFICSLLFFFTLTMFSDMEALLFPNRVGGWIEVGAALFTALVAASSIHPVCITVCFLCSGVLIFGINTKASQVYRAGK